MSETVKITFPDGSVREFDSGVSVKDVALSISQSLADGALGASVNRNLVGPEHKIDKDSDITIITSKHEKGIDILRNSASFLLSLAVSRTLPGAVPAVTSASEDGFYSDFDYPAFSDEDLEKVERKMKELSKNKVRFEAHEVPKEEARKLFEGNDFKLELVEEAEREKVTIFKAEDYRDILPAPLVPHAGRVKFFKLMRTSGSYWRGQAGGKQLQRIFGVVFFEKNELKKHLNFLEEAKQRDHRKLAKELELFLMPEEAIASPIFLPNGTIIWRQLEDYWREEHEKEGYQELISPLIFEKKLWEESGHWDKYKENMFFLEMNDVEYAVKPMNCPGHILAYKNRYHSYREFPLRYCELGIVHRNELSGVLQGLMRVVKFTQDDAHIFCTPDQVEEEVIKVLDLTDRMYKTLGFTYRMELSTRPEEFIGTVEMWDQATDILKRALEKKGLEYQLNEGDGAFYGPKIDYHVKDCLGRSWQCGTVQLDFQMPERFDVFFINKAGEKERPSIIHRTILGSFERLIGILIEHYAGRLPTWLSPVQTVVIPISEVFADYAETIFDRLKAEGIRVELDSSNETLNRRIKSAQDRKIPYIIIVGEKERSSGTISVRKKNEVTHDVKPDEFIGRLAEEIKSRYTELTC